MNQDHIRQYVSEASKVVGMTWPLYSFVTSNQLSGYESNHFRKATATANGIMGGQMFPQSDVFAKAYADKEIENGIITNLLKEHGIQTEPNQSLSELANLEDKETINKDHKVDRLMTKWLSAFMDEGIAEWSMPNRELGFYKSWSILAAYDKELKGNKKQEFQASSMEVLESLLKNKTKEECQRIIEYHIAALPGWAGYIKHRQEHSNLWDATYKIDLLDYLAVRLSICDMMGMDIIPNNYNVKMSKTILDLQYVWLKAWELSWQQNLAIRLKNQSPDTVSKAKDQAIPDAQLVFCIDTRSELIRRHVEQHGNYETFGYAGFFGIAMDYKSPEDSLSRKSCPPIVGSAYVVEEKPQLGKEAEYDKFQKNTARNEFQSYFLGRMKNMLPSAFGYVEGAGLFYAFSLLMRTLGAGSLYRRKKAISKPVENSTCPDLLPADSQNTTSDTISLDAKVGIVKSAFDLLGWTQFAPIVVFAGHGGHSANNPFGSSLDCGACAASPGRHNARTLASIANDDAVRKVLSQQHGYVIPEKTVFIGAEHNTTTDEILLFDTEVSRIDQSKLGRLKEDLKQVQVTATQERLLVNKDSVSLSHKKTNSWSETRPEWGLAKNAGFIIGPRSLSENINLEGNCFLHSYQWELDNSGAALEGIMQGPMTVTQWINNHYYFATVDNDKFGAGSKITHNVCGKFGVQQGNGGDLKFGLPLQSVKSSDTENYHKPLRLSVLIQAPTDRIEKILFNNPKLQSLLDNEWIYLMVMNPEDGNEFLTYHEGMKWERTLANNQSEQIKSSINQFEAVLT